MKRLETRGKGIFLLHDVHPAAVAALLGLLKELKQRGFHIVHWCQPQLISSNWPERTVCGSSEAIGPSARACILWLRRMMREGIQYICRGSFPDRR